MKTAAAQMPNRAAGQNLLLYDGVCGLCNRLNQFVLPRDTRHAFDFASIQSDAGRQVLTQFGRNPDVLSTFYVVVGYRGAAAVLLSKARAALFVMKTLGPPWSWLGVFGMLPDAVLDAGYDMIASNRYRLFGRYESCLMPSATYRDRFIDV
jgi:predicted DCC family thiol-disulfide oxidoreductase YuxK